MAVLDRQQVRAVHCVLLRRLGAAALGHPVGGTSPKTYAHMYDLRGNRLRAAVTASPTQTLTYNAANQIASTEHTYDGAGNLTATPTSTYTYNGAQQMTQAVTIGVTSAYTYAGGSENQVFSGTFSGETLRRRVRALNIRETRIVKESCS
jgi:hypothetical protein